MNPNQSIENILEHLLSQRQHGAQALSGFKYQILYSLHRIFDLFSDDNPIEKIRFEGIEDVDLVGFSVDNHFIQVKSSSSSQGFGWLNKEKILDKFIEVYKADNKAQFVLVTDFGFTGEFKDLVEFLNGKVPQLHPKTQRRLDKIAHDNELSDEEMRHFIDNVKIETVLKDKLITSIEADIIRFFQVSSGSEGLYFLALSAHILGAAANRDTFTKPDVVNILSQIDTWISRGKSNPAIEQGLIEKLNFQLEQNISDYYSGVGARPAHILANLDAQRSEWIKEIDKTLKNSPVTIIRASSGQGKSTLLYRYALTFYDSHSIYVLRNLRTPEQVVPVEQFLKSHIKLGVPILVLIDDLNDSVKYWHELAGRLSGIPVSFLIASREENWFRYAGNVQNLQWASVFPRLSITEAKDIFKQFKNDNRIASNISSAERAYEQVSDKKLLIEFVFLITQGQMLSERLAEQVKTIHFNQEDPAKLSILRLVSLGQTLETRLTVKNLFSGIKFNQDPEMVIKSMQGEYIEVSTDGYIEGLHFVRSEHLVQLLHEIVPVEHTLELLVDIVLSSELPLLVLNMFSLLKIDDASLIAKLVTRTKHNVETILAIVRNLFQADEYRYLIKNKSIGGAFVTEFGTNSLLTFFANANMPIQTDFDVYDAVKRFPNADINKIERMKALTDAMPDRDKNSLCSKTYLELAMQELSPNDLPVNLSATANLAQWADYFGLEFQAFCAFTEVENWIEEVLAHSVEEIADCLFAVWRRDESKYLKVSNSSGEQIQQIFKSWTKTIWIEERDEGEMYIEFIVDEEKPIHQQAMSRIETLWKLYPNFEKYSCQGLYPATDIERLGPDETRKSILHKTLTDKIPAEINGQYIAVLTRLFNTNPVLFDWVAKWQNWRIGVLEFLQELATRHEKMASGKRYNGEHLVKLWNLIRSTVNNPPDLPTKFKILLTEEEKAIKDWHKSVSNFLSNYGENLNLQDEHKKRLAILNLYEATGHLNDMQKAFSRIRRGELSFYTNTLTAIDEKATYYYLYNLLRYLSSEEQNYTRNRRISVKSLVNSWVELQQRRFVDDINQAFQPILKDGWTVYLPSDYLYEGILKSVCFAVEIESVNPIVKQLAPAFYGITQTNLDYEFIYIVPVINQKRVFSYCYRAARRTVNEIANGTYTGEKIGIFPLHVPPMVYDLIPELSDDILGEGQFLFEISQFIGILEALRKEVYLIHSKLSPNEQTFKDSLLEEIKNKLDGHMAKVEVVMKQAQQFSSTKALTEWSNILDYTRKAIEERKNNVFSVTDYTPTSLADDQNLLSLFDDYLKAEYF